MDISPIKNKESRFWSKISVGAADACWNWNGAKDKDGYGNVKCGKQVTKAHRIAYALHNGKWPDDSMVCHKCDNTSCCNPAHLWTGTNQDNQNDSVSKGRNKPGSLTGEENPGAKLSKEQATQAITMIAQGFTNKRIAHMLGVSHATISCIRLSKAWPELPRPANSNQFKRYASCRK